MQLELGPGIIAQVVGKKELQQFWQAKLPNASIESETQAGSPANTTQMKQLELALLASIEPRVQKQFMLTQVHQDRSHCITDKSNPEQILSDAQGADALYSSQPGYRLVIRTADCLPLFFAFHGQHTNSIRLAGVIHAGWRGMQKKIILKTLRQAWSICQQTRAQTAKGPAASIHWAIGPCISQMAYEVGPDVARHFEFLKGSEKQGHFKLDLSAEAKKQFNEFIDNINIQSVYHSDLEACTLLQNQDWYSHRAGDIFRNLNMIQIISPDRPKR